MAPKRPNLAAERLKRWRQPGSAGFFAFLDDVRPMIPSEKGPFQPFEWPNDHVKAEVARSLDGSFSTVIFLWPRRHGKTLTSALIIFWRFLTRQRQSIAIVANSERQSTDTAYRLLRDIMQETAFSKALIDAGSIKLGADTIEYGALNSRVQGYPANARSLFGKKLSLVQCSELHAARDDSVFQAMASATVDSEDGVVLIDSTVGSRRSPLYALFLLWQNDCDPSLFVSHIQYRDLEDAITNGPKWISGKKLRSRAAQMLPLEFGQQHLNSWSDSSNQLFPESLRNSISTVYPLEASSVADGRPFVVGAGLDRASGLSLSGDATETVCVVKTTGDDEEAHFYVLDQSTINFGSAGGIRRAFSRYSKDFGLRKATLEASNVVDILSWCQSQAFDAEAIFPTRERQASIFSEMHRIATEGRLHVHPKFKKIFKELETFEYRLEGNGAKGSIPVFQHAQGCHDDAIYALAWAIYSLRDEELNPFEMNGIFCNAKGPAVRMCILNGGDHIPLCAESCRSFKELEKLYEKYAANSGAATMNISHFFESKVTNIGPHVVKR